MCVCVLFPRGPLHLLARGAVWGCVLGPGLLPHPAPSGWAVGACVCRRGRPACTPPFLAGMCGVGLRAGLGFRLCSAPLGLVVGVCVCSCVCPACTPFFLGGRLWRRGVQVLLWVWFAPPPPLWCFPSGGGAVACRVVALCCQLLAVLVLGLVTSVPPSPLFRAALSCVFCFFCFCPSVVCVGVFGVLLLPVGHCSWFGVAGFWLGGPPVPLWGVPTSVLSGWGVWPSFVVWVGGFVAVGLCRAPPPSLHFFTGVGLHVPSSAFPGLVHALVGIRSGLPGRCWCLGLARPCPGPMGRVYYVHVGLAGPSCWVRFSLCGLGGCARRLCEAPG